MLSEWHYFSYYEALCHAFGSLYVLHSNTFRIFSLSVGFHWSMISSFWNILLGASTAGLFFFNLNSMTLYMPIIGLMSDWHSGCSRVNASKNLIFGNGFHVTHEEQIHLSMLGNVNSDFSYNVKQRTVHLSSAALYQTCNMLTNFPCPDLQKQEHHGQMSAFQLQNRSKLVALSR